MRAWICLTPMLLAACTGSYEPTPLTQKQATKLEEELAGKVAGEKVSCIDQRPQTNLTVISNNVLLYRVNKRLIYKNELMGSCNGLTFGDTLIVRVFGTQLCRGDLASSANLMSGMTTGSCALGDFIPYRTPGK